VTKEWNNEEKTVEERRVNSANQLLGCCSRCPKIKNVAVRSAVTDFVLQMARTIYNPQWSYLLALERGWIPKGDLNDERIINSCHREDVGAFVCEANREAPEETVRNGMKYALGEGKKDSEYIYKLGGEQLYSEGDTVFDEFWKAHRAQGGTCDFGGGAILREENVTHSNDYYTDDYYNAVEKNEFAMWKIVLLVVMGVLVGSLTGFFLAMKLSPKFSRRVRSSVMLRPVTSSRVFRQSFGNLLEPGLQGYAGISMD
jgi:hypothetical protein